MVPENIFHGKKTKTKMKVCVSKQIFMITTKFFIMERRISMKYLQKLGKALMLPVACLPICGILMGFGYLFCPASMQGGDIVGFVPKL